MDRLCVFCGSSSGAGDVYQAGARLLGQTLAGSGITVVYGGASVGLMGTLADAALAAGGEVIGVIPQALQEREISHTGLTDLRVVGSMHERKALMAGLSDGFIALPGGAGTLEEFFEVWTWAQLGEHGKPCGLLNVGGYYDPMLTFLEHMVAQGFLSEKHRGMVLVEKEPESLLQRLSDYRPPETPKWLDPTET
ncbi:MAG: TIGR00730 family Rossman fold protein [Rubrobacteraceae bacterium]